MCTEEITGVVINSDYVTNDPSKIDMAAASRQPMEYVSRDRARRLARQTDRAEWRLLAEAPALFVIVDGIRYRRSSLDAQVNFPVSVPAMTPLPCVAG